MLVPLRVLIVDDNVSFATLLRRRLVAGGHACAVAHTLAAAVEAVEMNSFDAVVTDLHLGYQSGIQLLRLVRSAAPSTRRILMSGSSSEDLPDDPAAHQCLMKPFELQELLDAIEQDARS